MGTRGRFREWWGMRRAVAAGRRADARDSEPVVVAIFRTEAEARLAAGHLTSAGIPAGVTLDQPEGFAGGLTEAARVQVPRRHQAAAERLLVELTGGD